MMRELQISIIPADESDSNQRGNHMEVRQGNQILGSLTVDRPQAVRISINEYDAPVVRLEASDTIPRSNIE